MPRRGTGTASPERQVAEPVDENQRPGVPLASEPPHWSQRDREDVVKDILQLFEDGENLRFICRLPYMPSRTLLHRWMEEDPTLNERIARARVLWRASLEDECAEIADGANAGNVDVAKLRIWTRLQLLDRADAVAKANPPKVRGYVPPEVRFIGVEPYRPPALEGEATVVEDDDL